METRVIMGMNSDRVIYGEDFIIIINRDNSILLFDIFDSKDPIKYGSLDQFKNNKPELWGKMSHSTMKKEYFNTFDESDLNLALNDIDIKIDQKNNLCQKTIKFGMPKREAE